MKKLLIVSLMFVIATSAYFFWEATLPAKALGPVDPSTITSGNIWVWIMGESSTGADREIRCILKPSVNGWYVLNDTGHRSINCGSVTQDGSSITLSHAALTKVHTSSVDADETMTVDGYSTGASVGLSSSVIMIGN